MLAAVSLMFPYLFGLGCLLFPVCRGIKSEILAYNDSDRLQLLGNILVFGIVLNQILVLSIANIRMSLMFGCVLSFVGFMHFVVSRAKGLPPIIAPGWFAILAALCTACLFIVLIEPLNCWDARSVWFFHAKMIFYQESVYAGGNWSLPSIVFSHPDYPGLIPVLAAQIALVAGYWNEYLPKMSLAALLVPAILCLISVLREKWWHLVFIAAPLVCTWEWLKNGYMDGYFALYAGLATFFWGRWLDKKNRLDLISGILFIGVILQLKNEGTLYCLILAVLIAFSALIKKDGFRAANLIRHYECLLLFSLSVSGFFLWARIKLRFGLQNDLHVGLNWLDKISVRLTDGSLPIILKQLYVTYNINLSLGILLLSLVFTLRAGRRPGIVTLFCSLAGMSYFCGLVVIYLGTPYDLIGFQLPSGNRTMLPVHIIFLAASYSLFCRDDKNLEPPSWHHSEVSDPCQLSQRDNG